VCVCTGLCAGSVSVLLDSNLIRKEATASSSKGYKACCTRSSLSPVTDCSDARSLCAQSCGQHGSRVPQWLPKRLGRNTRHTVASVFVQAAQHSSNGRPICAAQKFTQEQVSSDVHRRRRWGRPLSSSAHARTTQDPDRARHGSHLPAALGPRCSNTHQSLQLSPSAMISSPTVQLAECCENVGSGRARTY